MNVISLQVGRPRDVESHGRTITTSISKSPVEGRVRVGPTGIEGNQQADLTVHGGPNKAVYVYPSEHYASWRRELPDLDLPWGAFGENLTTEGLLETEVCIGDRLHIGSADFVVIQPRMPCFKLGVRFGRDDMVKRFLQSRRSGFYLGVLREGEIGRGDAITFTSRAAGSVSVTDVVNLYVEDVDDVNLHRRALAAPGLPEKWTDHFRERLAALGA